AQRMKKKKKVQKKTGYCVAFVLKKTNQKKLHINTSLIVFPVALSFQLLKEMAVEVPPEHEVVQEVVTVVQELQEGHLEETWAGEDHSARLPRGTRASVCVCGFVCKILHPV
ncbi:MAG: hypothetical protein ACRCTW_01250, partial [Lactococcus garvieae]